jgi:hypothetical protein
MERKSEHYAEARSNILQTTHILTYLWRWR